MKNKIAKLHNDLNKVLAEFASANGLIVAPFNIRYNETSFKCASVTFAEKSVVGDVANADVKALVNLKKREVLYFGKKVAGTEFVFGGDTLRIDGLRGKKVIVTKMKCGGIAVKNKVGNRFVFPVESVCKIISDTGPNSAAARATSAAISASIFGK